MEKGHCKELMVNVSKVIEEGESPCPSYISLTFPKPDPVDYLVFQNYYVSSITIKQYIIDVDSYRTILKDYKLTSWPHFENDAENWYIIPSSFYNGNYDPYLVKEFRIYLSQPSPNWKHFSLKNITAYKILMDSQSVNEKPKTLFEKFKDNVRQKLNVLNNPTSNDAPTYDEALIGNTEINRIELSRQH